MQLCIEWMIGKYLFKIPAHYLQTSDTAVKNSNSQLRKSPNYINI